MPYKVTMYFKDGEVLEDDEEFASESEADAHGQNLCNDYATGVEVLHLSNPGDNPLEEDDADYEVIEF